MVIIDHDYMYGAGDKFTIKLSEPGFGVRAITYRRATLEEAQMALVHYYAAGDKRYTPDRCVICQRLAENRVKAARKETRRTKNRARESVKNPNHS